MSGKGGKRSTSYGGIKGNKPGATGAHGKAGRRPDAFYIRMAFLAERAAESKRLERLLADENQDDDAFFKAFDRVTAFAFSKAPAREDVTADATLTIIRRDEGARE